MIRYVSLRIVLLLAALVLSPAFLHAADPTPTAGLNAEESEKLAAARAAVMRSPEMRAATAKYNEARKAYQEDRRKYPAERDKEVAIAFRKATADYERAKTQALLASDPSLEALLAKEAAARTAGRKMNEGETVADSDSRQNPAVRPAKEVPGLPRVLLIGDSISIGYTLQVRKLLEGKANVQRIPINGGATEVGLANLKQWLGDKKWDVIHFNFGLHDAKNMSSTEFRTTRDQYAENLGKLVARLKESGARLIFATTTPVPNGGKLGAGRTFDDIAARNEVAVQVMKANDVAIDDLYAVVLPRLGEIARPNDVHFKPEGYDVLARAVADSIAAQLPRN